ncbi:MAG TPA: ABC transporter permease [Prolixibacteraceae bacterium]|nr:ABC transporter permease [Bacteroidales bacterium]HOY51566.1 ABC transporter permease [Prolixibacteraceae bacterium]HPJ77248.1 ABC transporter permease [Prolixibacteraceae bacterium]HRV89070.1 ABC transporter permease [Prolixibacteraceae bacterium]
MNKTWLILKREYLIRVKKKSFIVTTLLVPLFFAALMFVPMWLATRDDKQERIIAVYDESTLFYDQLGQEGFTKYHFIEQEKFNALKSDLNDEEFYAVLYIPGNIYTVNKAELLSKKQVPIDLAEQIERKLSQVIETDKRRKVIEESQMPDLEQKLAGTKTKVSVSTLKVTETGEQKKSSSMVAFFASYLMGFIIYFFVFMYGSMVMRSVMEEKKNRIVEVIVSSVKPYQLMAGKIVGTALVGLTQVAIWIVIGVAVMGVVQNFLSPETAQQVGQSVMESQQQMGQAPAAMATEGNQMAEIMENIANLNIPLIIFGFVFYFLLGYLLYSSLLGAVGAAVDNDEDVQQMIFPITFPLILAIIMLVAISRNPEGSLAFWASIIPLTSPVCMLARLPFSPPAWEIALSMLLLLATTVGAIWAGAKIYRTGILMYGKKVTFKELAKWLTYKG